MSVRIRLIEIASALVRRSRIIILRRLRGYKNIDKSVIIESEVTLDRINPSGIYIDSNTLVGSGTTILSHEHVYRQKNGSCYMADTRIGKNCFIGVKSIICPGVEIGDECIIGAGSVVTKSVPSHSLAAGVPARIIKTGIKMNEKAVAYEIVKD